MRCRDQDRGVEPKTGLSAPRSASQGIDHALGTGGDCASGEDAAEPRRAPVDTPAGWNRRAAAWRGEPVARGDRADRAQSLPLSLLLQRPCNRVDNDQARRQSTELPDSDATSRPGCKLQAQARAQRKPRSASVPLSPLQDGYPDQKASNPDQMRTILILGTVSGRLGTMRYESHQARKAWRCSRYLLTDIACDQRRQAMWSRVCAATTEQSTGAAPGSGSAAAGAHYCYGTQLSPRSCLRGINVRQPCSVFAGGNGRTTLTAHRAACLQDCCVAGTMTTPRQGIDPGCTVQSEGGAHWGRWRSSGSPGSRCQGHRPAGVLSRRWL